MRLRVFLFAVMVAASTLAQAGDESVAENIAACNRAIGEGDASKALAFAELVLKQDKANRQALLCKGRAHGGTGQFDQAINALMAAEKLSTTPMEHIIALTLIGNVQKSAQHYPEALAAYQQSLELAKSANDANFQRIDLNLIGDTLVASGDLKGGLQHYLQGSTLAANDNERADGFARIASTYSSLQQHDQAVEYQLKAVMMQERAGDLDQFCDANLELGRIYTSAQDYPNAEKYIQKVIKLAKDQGGAYWEAKGYYYLAQAKAASKHPEEARQLLADAQHITQDIGAERLGDEIARSQQSLPRQ